MLTSHHADLLTTDFGLEALYEAACERDVPTAAWPSPASADTLVAWLLAREDDPAIAKVLELARIRVGYRGPALGRVAFLGKAARALRDPERAARSLEAILKQALEDRGFPGHAQVTIETHPKYARLSVALPSRWMRVSTAAGEDALAFRTSAATLTYVPPLLDVSAAHPPHVALLASALGAAAFEDPAFFAPALLVCLRALQRGPRAFRIPAAFAGEIERLRMIECDWDSGHSVNLHFSGADVPKEMKKLGLRIEGGELLSATLRFNFKTAPFHADVTLCAPNELTCSEPSRAALVFACLGENEGARAGDAAVRFWVPRAVDPVGPRGARVLRPRVRGAREGEGARAIDDPRRRTTSDYPASGRRPSSRSRSRASRAFGTARPTACASRRARSTRRTW